MELEYFEEQILFSTACMTVDGASGGGSTIGTGFFMSVPLPDAKRSLTLLISNKHVFKNPTGDMRINVNQRKNDGSPDYGNLVTIGGQYGEDIYSEHPNSNVDLACINASMIASVLANAYFRTLTLEMISDFTEKELTPCKDVFFVGYPDNRFDVANNLPLVRKGIIASAPKLDFNGMQQFVIDAQVYGGSSGSPLFAILDGKPKLLGVVTATMIKHGKLESVPAAIDTLGVQLILGLGLVIKATLIRDLVNVAIQHYLKNDSQV